MTLSGNSWTSDMGDVERTWPPEIAGVPSIIKTLLLVAGGGFKFVSWMTIQSAELLNTSAIAPA